MKKLISTIIITVFLAQDTGLCYLAEADLAARYALRPEAYVNLFAGQPVRAADAPARSPSQAEVKALAGQLAILDLDTLMPTEETVPEKFSKMEETLGKGDYFDEPIIVDANPVYVNGKIRYVILDGNHRFGVMKKKGYKYILVRLVDYNDPAITFEIKREEFKGTITKELVRQRAACGNPFPPKTILHNFGTALIPGAGPVRIKHVPIHRKLLKRWRGISPVALNKALEAALSEVELEFAGDSMHHDGAGYREQVYSIAGQESSAFVEKFESEYEKARLLYKKQGLFSKAKDRFYMVRKLFHAREFDFIKRRFAYISPQLRESVKAYLVVFWPRVGSISSFDKNNFDAWGEFQNKIHYGVPSPLSKLIRRSPWWLKPFIIPARAAAFLLKYSVRPAWFLLNLFIPLNKGINFFIAKPKPLKRGMDEDSTYSWALRTGFNRRAAHRVAAGCMAVDSLMGSVITLIFCHIFGDPTAKDNDWKRHFNIFLAEDSMLDPEYKKFDSRFLFGVLAVSRAHKIAKATKRRLDGMRVFFHICREPDITDAELRIYYGCPRSGDTKRPEGADSRVESAAREMLRASRRAKDNNDMFYFMSMMLLGKGMHSMQDKISHSKWDFHKNTPSHPIWYDHPDIDDMKDGYYVFGHKRINMTEFVSLRYLAVYQDMVRGKLKAMSIKELMAILARMYEDAVPAADMAQEFEDAVNKAVKEKKLFEDAAEDDKDRLTQELIRSLGIISGLAGLISEGKSFEEAEPIVRQKAQEMLDAALKKEFLVPVFSDEHVDIDEELRQAKAKSKAPLYVLNFDRHSDMAPGESRQSDNWASRAISNSLCKDVLHMDAPGMMLEKICDFLPANIKRIFHPWWRKAGGLKGKRVFISIDMDLFSSNQGISYHLTEADLLRRLHDMRDCILDSGAIVEGVFVARSRSYLNRQADAAYVAGLENHIRALFRSRAASAGENHESQRAEVLDTPGIHALSAYAPGAMAASLSPLAIDLQTVTAPEDEARRKVFLIFAGRVAPEKNAAEFIKLAAELKNSYRDKNVEICSRMIGVVDPAYKKKLLQTARESNIEDIEFYGAYLPEEFIDIMSKYPREDTIVVHALGLVTREVMSLGFPIVTRDSTVKRGIYRAAEQDYVKAIEDLIDHPEKAEILIEESRREAEELYSSGIWLNNMMAIVESVIKKPLNNRLRAYFTFSGFGYGRHGVNEYYNKFFRYLAKRKDINAAIDLLSMQQLFFLGQALPERVYVKGVIEKENVRQFNTYQHKGRHAQAKAPDEAEINAYFLPALKELVNCIMSVEYDAGTIFKVTPDSRDVVQRALEAMRKLQDYFQNGYDPAQTMLSPVVEEYLKSVFSGDESAISAQAVAYDRKGTPTDHFAKLISLMYMLAEKMPEGKDVSFTSQLFPPVLSILHRQKGGPPVIYIEHANYGVNEKAVIRSVEKGEYPDQAREFMKKYIALLKMITVHSIDGYINPWRGDKLRSVYGDFFRGQGFLLPHGVDTDFYVYKGGAKAVRNEAARGARVIEVSIMRAA